MKVMDSSEQSSFTRARENYLKDAKTLLSSCFSQEEFGSWWKDIETDFETAFLRYGQADQWELVLSRLPEFTDVIFNCGDTVSVSSRLGADNVKITKLNSHLRSLMPWRKGPFNFHGVAIDAEWQSNLKWDRISGAIGGLDNAAVLDVGCGNGYYAWRMLDAGAKLVVGLDPSILCLSQFRAMKFYQQDAPITVLPVGTESLKYSLNMFDVVFSMGVLYHRRDPLEHLSQLMRAVGKGGRIVLETLVIDSDGLELFIPKDRYAQMRNVWSVPSPKQIMEWLSQAGFVNIACIDKTVTSLEEQRSTSWMTSYSLENFLDPENHDLTIEGYPAPVRACFIADAP
jgi:tRNA (mo5U34)-methyltransferase